jgi:hypothetical protein
MRRLFRGSFSIGRKSEIHYPDHSAPGDKPRDLGAGHARSFGEIKMNPDLDCEGLILLGPLPWEISERLAQFAGNWLEFSPKDNAIVVRKTLPLGCPATTAVSCELITMMGSLPAENRLAAPGGEIFVRSENSRIMRFSVQQGEIRIQWPYKEEPCRAARGHACEIVRFAAHDATVNGWARFVGDAQKINQLQEFVARFDGLFPEEDMPSEAEQNVVFVRFKNVGCDPAELLATIKSLADPADSIEGEMEVRSPDPSGESTCQRIVLDKMAAD